MQEILEKEPATQETLTPETILAAFDKLFDASGRGVRRFKHSGLRYVKLKNDAVLVEQNPHKLSEWAELARSGRSIAWAMREGRYMARVVDGEVEMLASS
ncbi:MAG TPA: hypothetical protein VNA19_14980 [Pyrinomonadaceae bacterium]|nr:hypothetical protein [Pyrinomonadaceae bacterium]